MQSENKLGTMPISKLIWNMSLPIIASMLVQALYNIVDSVFVSRVSEQALTAVSLAFPAQNLMIGLATGTAVGVNALMGRALGAVVDVLAFIPGGPARVLLALALLTAATVSGAALLLRGSVRQIA